MPNVIKPVDRVYQSVTEVYPKPCSFDPQLDLSFQQQRIRARYAQLVKLPEKNFHASPVIEYRSSDDPRFDEVRFHICPEPANPDFTVPAHLLLPKNAAGKKLPCVICLQGHSTGMHISMGRPIYEGDEATINGGDRDYALQAVAEGYIAVVMEQRGLGELKSGIESAGCHHMAFESLMAGRTLQGDRIHDVRCLVDALECFDEVDAERIAITGNSGGGTTSYHAAALEERIKVSMPCCSFCTYQDSILAMYHCSCNYVPGIADEMEMADLALAIAPRPLIVINGKEDAIFPVDAGSRAFETVRAIYAAAGAPENCRRLIGDGGHRYYAALAWPNLKDFI